jgi:hypothetical protein
VHWLFIGQECGSFDERENAFTLEDRLESVVRGLAKANHDGHEFGAGWRWFYMYGDDADVLANAVMPILRESRGSERVVPCEALRAARFRVRSKCRRSVSSTERPERPKSSCPFKLRTVCLTNRFRIWLRYRV